MGRSWFYLAGNQPVGPLSWDELRIASRAGVVRPDTQVREGTAGPWRPAAEVAASLWAAPPPVGRPVPPPIDRGAPSSAGAAPPLPAAGSGKRPRRRARGVKLLAGLIVGLLAAAAGWAWWHWGALRAARVGATTAEADNEQPKRRRSKREASVAPAAAAASRRAAVPRRPPVEPFETSADAGPQGRIDELVFARLDQLHLAPANPCSDATFVRRVYLDAIGTLPTVQEAREFLADRDPNKRRVLVDRLLERDEFADYWAMKWSDLLRIKAEFPINLWPNAAQAYHRWVRTALRSNLPYDRFVREILTSSGSNFRVPQVNFYRAVQSRQPQAIAQAVALTFMGTRTEGWPPERLAGMSAFFTRIAYKPTAEWKEEIVLFDPRKTPETDPGKAAPGAVFPDGTRARPAADRDPRKDFADWLIDAKNPWFARNIVNRIWYWLLGRGIVEEPDDLRPDNPPQNPELLAWLQRQLVESHWDLKQVYRLILTSQTYQLSSLPQSQEAESARNFGHYPLRRLEAEVLVDALCQITGTHESYTSAIPEPFTFVPDSVRSVALPDASISSALLEMFGRPPRDTGLDAERNNRPTTTQCLYLLNSSHVQRKIEESQPLRALAAGGKKPRQVAEGLYLAILSRPPTEDELRVILARGQSGPKEKTLLSDVAWALVNSAEFLYRH